MIVPCSIRNPDPDHPGLAEVFGDAALRGAWLAVKVIAWQARASANGGRIVLSAGDRQWIGGCTKPARTARERARMVRASDALVRDLCTKMSWTVHEHDPFWTVQVENVHGSCTARDEKPNEIAKSTARNSPTCAPSEVRSQKSEERREKREQSGAGAPSAEDRAPSQRAVSEDPDPAPPELAPAAEPIAAQAGQATLPGTEPPGASDDPLCGHRPLLNLLRRLPGSPREKELWLADEIDVMELEADKEPTREARSKALRAMAVRWYKAYLRRPLITQGSLNERKYEREERRERERKASLAQRARYDADPEVQRLKAECLAREQNPRPLAADDPFMACILDISAQENKRVSRA